LRFGETGLSYVWGFVYSLFKEVEGEGDKGKKEEKINHLWSLTTILRPSRHKASQPSEERTITGPLRNKGVAGLDTLMIETERSPEEANLLKQKSPSHLTVGVL